MILINIFLIIYLIGLAILYFNKNRIINNNFNYHVIVINYMKFSLIIFMTIVCINFIIEAINYILLHGLLSTNVLIHLGIFTVLAIPSYLLVNYFYKNYKDK